MPMNYIHRMLLPPLLSLGCVLQPPGQDEGSTGGGDATAGSSDTETGGPPGKTEEGETEGCETEGCETEAEAYECLRALVYAEGLLGVTTRQAPEQPEEGHEILQGVILAVDPITAERTELVLGEPNTSFDHLVLAGDGGYLVGGEGYDDGLSGLPLLQKYAVDGSLEWTAPLEYGNVLDFAMHGDEILVADGHSHAILVVVSAVDGSLVGEVSGEYQSSRVEVDALGNVYVAGRDSEVVDGAILSQTAFLRKYGPDLQLQWEQLEPTILEGAGVVTQGLAVDADGGAIVATRENDDGLDAAITFRKYDPDGNPLWAIAYDQQVPGGALDGSVDDLRARPGGGFIAIGRIIIDEGEAFTFAYDADGTLLWSDLQAHDHLTIETNRGLAVTSDAIYVAGCGLETDPPGGAEGWLLQFEP